MTVKEPEKLWAQLKKPFDHQAALCKPLARQEWMNLRFQDYTSVTTYNSALHNITSRLTFCGVDVTDEDKIERTLSTFHPAQVTMQRAYRNQALAEYSELISTLLVAEQNDQVLLRNHAKRPTGTLPRPEANYVAPNSKERTRRGRGHAGT